MSPDCAPLSNTTPRWRAACLLALACAWAGLALAPPQPVPYPWPEWTGPAMPAPERAKVARNVWSTRGAPVDDPVPVLLLLLLDADPVVRLEAVRGMGSRGAWDPRATRPLLRALQDPDIRVVRSAAFGAAHLDPRPAEMLPIAVEVLLNPPAAQAGADGATIRKECLEQLVFLVYLLGRRPDARNAMRRLWKDPRLPETARAELQWRMRQLRIDPASPMEPE